MKLHPISAAAAGALALSLQGCVTPIVVTVKDDLGQPVSGLKLSAEAFNASRDYALAMRGIRGKNEEVFFVTDELGIGRVRLTGAVEYLDETRLEPNVYIHPEDDSKFWRYTVRPTREKAFPPSPLQATIILRQKITPHLMNYGEMDLGMWEQSPEKNALFLKKSEVGYDMVYGDFLPPLGNGVRADIILRAEVLPNEKFSAEEQAHFFVEESRKPDPGPKPASRPPLNVRYTFRFIGEGNGVIPVPMPGKDTCIIGLATADLDSDRPGYNRNLAHVIPQAAPDSGYQSVIIRHREFIPKAEKDSSFTTPERLAKRSWWIFLNGKHDIQRNAVYFFRIRGEKNLRGAYYGVIKSDFCIRERGGAYMQYIINPMAGERNVEELQDREFERRWRKLPLMKRAAE